ncbi:MAG: hypothetical protein J6Y21_05055 [Clostridia bacterium]|nr:hypothetical protein [Clostridia bacterium]
MTDNEILELINKRDEAALREIERQYSARCQNIAKEITGSEEAARECFFDAMISLWNGGNISPAAGGGQDEPSGQIGEYLERKVRIAAEKRAGSKAKTPAETSGVVIAPAAAVFPAVSGVSDISDLSGISGVSEISGIPGISDISDFSETGKTGNIISGTQGHSDAPAGASENGEKAASGTGANADAAGISGISGISGTGKKKQRKVLIITGIIAAVVIAAALIAFAARIHRSAGDANEPSIVAHNSATPDVSPHSPRPTDEIDGPFEYGVSIIANDNAILPEILSDYVKSYEPLVFSSEYMEGKIQTETEDLNLTFWEAYQGVSYARENPCGGVLKLDNYNFDPTEKIGFSFTTQMTGTIVEKPGQWYAITYMVEYSGIAEIRTDGEQIIACTVNTIRPLAFDSKESFLLLNPNLPESFLTFLKKNGIEVINSYIKDIFSFNLGAEPKGDKYGNIAHITQVLFKWNKEKDALHIYKNCTSLLNLYREITYDYSGNDLKSVTVYTLDMSSVIYKESAGAIIEKPGSASDPEWYGADPDEPDFYVHTFGADNCRTIYTFKDWRLSKIELRSGQYETKDSISIATVVYTFNSGLTPSENRLVRTSHYGYKKVFLQFEPGGNICQREVIWHNDMIESLSISKGYFDPDGDLTYSEQFKLDDGSVTRRLYHTTGYKDKVLVLASEVIFNPDNSASGVYYDCAGNVIVTYNCQYDMDGEIISESFDPGDNNSSASVLLFGTVNPDSSGYLITALNTGRGVQSRRMPYKLMLLDDGHFEFYMTETVSLPVSALSSSAFLVSVQLKYTGTILEGISDESEDYYRLRFEKREFIGLRATSYEELYDYYNSINDSSVFFDEFGKKFAACKDEAEFEGLMREYLEMVTGPRDVTDEAMPDIYINKRNYVETAVSMITCYIDPPPVAVPITDPIFIDD